MEERRTIQNKLYNVCITCLGWKGSKDHYCPVRSCPRCGSSHNILLCNSDKALTDKTFRCEGYVSDKDLTEDPEALLNEDKCFLTQRKREPSEIRPTEKQMEQVKTILKSLSLKQQKEPELGEPNDRIAFLQSGRVNDKILKIHEEGGSVNGDSKVESEVNSPSNGEDTDEMPALTDSDVSDIEGNDEFPPMPPLTNREPSDSESEVGKEDDRKHQGPKY